LNFEIDAIVVGAGIFGSTIARALRADGRKVTVFDDRRPLNGSAPSGCLMKPSWFSSLGEGVYTPSLEMLDSLYGVKDIEFTIRPSGLKAKVHWVPNEVITNTSDLTVLNEKVDSIELGRVTTIVPGSSTAKEYEAPLIVIAAGVWSRELATVPELIGKQGISFRLPHSHLSENTIQGWAPYKQAVVFQETSSSIWAGDGTAIKPENWTEARADKSLDRMKKVTSFTSMSMRHATCGIRPYVPKVKGCFLEEQANGFWVATGGAKNGLVAAGWAAHEIVRKTP